MIKLKLNCRFVGEQKKNLETLSFLGEVIILSRQTTDAVET
jgi:hypothetical protein